ncbi:Vesicular integral-membrane protein VIP36 [Papilio machaon]|uniref:Vesicular integral-membrane protein VIP36 n=1 Tax=Papilio machaon TaxID=76193 RepID=A0A194RP57_PAPMA|nr:Vesicular integral-membrane protein VIP36 [Papilio machaon]
MYYEKLLFIKFLFISVFYTSVFAEWNTRDYIMRQHSLTKPYQGSGMSVPHWDFLGSTIVTSNYVRLTPDMQSKSGAIWNTSPCQTRNWELQVQFKVHGRGKDLFGDGFALWYVRDRMQTGPVFGSKDYFHGLAIVLDTYSNHNGAHNQNKDEDRSKIIPSAASFEAPRDRVDDTKPAMSGVKSFLYMMFVAIVIMVVLVLGIMWYQKRQEQSRKRLY